MTTSNPGEWGYPFADGLAPGDPPRPLVCLVDVLLHLMASMPLRPAIERMRSRLADHHGLQLFELQPAAWAAPVTDACVWRPGQEAGSRWQHPRAAGGRRVLSYGLGRPADRVQVAVPAVTELRGVAGVLAALDELDLRAMSPDQVLRNAALQVAMLVGDAAALFGYGAPTANTEASSAYPARVVSLRLVPDAAQAEPTRAEKIATACSSIQQPERNAKGQVSWASAVTARRFLGAYEALENAGAKVDDALQMIADQWHCGKGSSLRKQMTRCRDLLRTIEAGRHSTVG